MKFPLSDLMDAFFHIRNLVENRLFFSQQQRNDIGQMDHLRYQRLLLHRRLQLLPGGLTVTHHIRERVCNGRFPKELRSHPGQP